MARDVPSGTRTPFTSRAFKVKHVGMDAGNHAVAHQVGCHRRVWCRCLAITRIPESWLALNNVICRRFSAAVSKGA